MSAKRPEIQQRDRNLLIVEDDLQLRQLLQKHLENHGYQTKGVGDGEAMQRALQRDHYDLMILDIGLPGTDGLTLCSRLRAERNPIPILILTARGDDVDRIIGLEIGADDYLAKPCNTRELLARIKAILRRTTPLVHRAPFDSEQAVYRFGDFVLNLTTRSLEKNGTALPITSGEFAVLSVMVQRPGLPLTRSQLMHLTGSETQTDDSRAIDIHISRLRKLIEAPEGKPRYLKTVWGMGYTFVGDGAVAHETENLRNAREA